MKTIGCRGTQHFQTNPSRKRPRMWTMNSCAQCGRCVQLCHRTNPRACAMEETEPGALHWNRFRAFLQRRCYFEQFKTDLYKRLPSGELSHSNGKIHHAINGKIHYFDWAIFNCYVSSPEGNHFGIMIRSWHMAYADSCSCDPTMVQLEGPSTAADVSSIASAPQKAQKIERLLIWVNFITTSLFSLTGIMVNQGNHPREALIQVGEIS